MDKLFVGPGWKLGEVWHQFGSGSTRQAPAARRNQQNLNDLDACPFQEEAIITE
jgi:hypothetical protein